MKILSRWDNQIIAIDNLTFTYRGNQLMRTYNTGMNSIVVGFMGFKNRKNTRDNYVYDVNVRLVKYFNDNITDIQYNVLNLPSKVTFDI